MLCINKGVTILLFFEIATTILMVVCAVVGCSISIFTYRRSMLDAIWQWTQLDGRQDVISARQFVQYELIANYNPSDIRANKDGAATKIAPITNAYHHLGMLVKQRYIPVSIFKNNSTGKTIVIIYEKLLPYITEVRKEHNTHYASGFEYLYNKVKKYYLTIPAKS